MRHKGRLPLLTLLRVVSIPAYYENWFTLVKSPFSMPNFEHHQNTHSHKPGLKIIIVNLDISPGVNSWVHRRRDLWSRIAMRKSCYVFMGEKKQFSRKWPIGCDTVGSPWSGSWPRDSSGWSELVITCVESKLAHHITSDLCVMLNDTSL